MKCSTIKVRPKTIILLSTFTLAECFTGKHLDALAECFTGCIFYTDPVTIQKRKKPVLQPRVLNMLRQEELEFAESLQSTASVRRWHIGGSEHIFCRVGGCSGFRGGLSGNATVLMEGEGS